jgi:predicted Holliday junction resolvase-like endonuclease
MEIIVALLIGIIIGSAITYYILQKSQQRKIIREYESKIQILKEEYQQSINQVRNRSIDGSRAVIKGKIAEQLAPVLPNFKYLPSDARFIGDPIDYIVFNGYTNIKDNNGIESNLEIVILDVKTGNASLSSLQQAILKAVNAGRVRFEVVRPEIPEQNQIQETLLSNSPQKAYNIQDIRKTHARAYKPWSNEEDKRLKKRYSEGETIDNLALEFQRKPGGISSRLRKLGLIE